MKRLKKMSITALIVSALPLAVLIPAILHITLSEEVRMAWSGCNMAFILAGLSLSIVCVSKEESRSIINILSLILSIVWLLLILGIITMVVMSYYLR